VTDSGGPRGAGGDPTSAAVGTEADVTTSATPRRWRDLSLLLPVFGLGLLLPPIIDVAGAAGPVLGLPAGVVYVFGVWAALIVIAARMSRPLSRGRLPEGRERGR
jgi:hypothetical protein